MENIKFRLLKIDTRQFAILQEAYDPTVEKFQFSFSINFSFPEPKSRMVCSSCLVKYNGETSPFLLLEVALYFEVEQKSWDFIWDVDANQIKLPKSTAQHMLTYLVGTTRGVLHSETNNTEFNKLILPTINLNDLINEDIIHSFPKTEEELDK